MFYGTECPSQSCGKIAQSMSSIAKDVHDDKVRKASVRTLIWSTVKLAMTSFVRAVGPVPENTSPANVPGGAKRRS